MDAIEGEGRLQAGNGTVRQDSNGVELTWKA